MLESRLKKPSLFRLEKRHLREDIQGGYKILNGPESVSRDSLFSNLSPFQEEGGTQHEANRVARLKQ